MIFIGLDVDNTEIKISVLNAHKEIIENKSFLIKDLNTSKNVNQLYSEVSKTCIISTALPLQEVLIKNADFDIKKSFFMKKAVKFQNELITTIDPEKTLSSYIKQNSFLKFFITTKDILKKHLCNLKKLNIDPDLVACHAISLSSFTRYFYKGTKNAFLVHIGENKTSCVLLKNYLPEKTFTIKQGLPKTKHASTKTKFDPIIHTQDNSEFLAFKKKLEDTLISLSHNEPDNYPLILTGEIEKVLNFEKFLEKDSILNPIFSEILEKNPKLKKFAISIGLALNSLSKEKYLIQFRKGDFAPIKKIKKFGKKILFFNLFFIFSTLFVYFGSNFFYNKKIKLLDDKMSSLQEFEKKEFGTSFIFHENDDIFSKINLFDDYLKKQKDTFSFLSKIPNVTETLLWLNNHSLLTTSEIISLNYDLESLPSVFSKNLPYKAKVKIEFITKTPSIARSFYDALTKTGSIADLSKEISWEVKDTSYVTSFYLKEKTIR